MYLSIKMTLSEQVEAGQGLLEWAQWSSKGPSSLATAENGCAG